MNGILDFVNKRIQHVESSATSSMGLGRILELNLMKFEIEKLLKNEKQQQISEPDIKA